MQEDLSKLVIVESTSGYNLLKVTLQQLDYLGLHIKYLRSQPNLKSVNLNMYVKLARLNKTMRFFNLLNGTIYLIKNYLDELRTFNKKIILINLSNCLSTGYKFFKFYVKI